MGNEYLENARKVLAIAELGHGLGRIDRQCKDCVYYKGESFFRLFATCGHPLVALAASQSEDSFGSRRLIRCDNQRDKRSIWGTVVCGPDAALFVSKDQHHD